MARASSVSRESGAVSVMIAAAIGAMFVVSALVTDVGLLYQERRQLQSSVDAAALAGAMDLAENRGPLVAETTARRYVAENANVTPDLVEVSFPGPSRVLVSSRTSRNLFFARVFGRDRAAVVAEASATHGLANTVNNLAPIIVPLQFVGGHVGEANLGTFELGEDRPSDPFSKTSEPSGSDTKYTISFTNTAAGSVDISIRDPLPAGVTYVPGSATSGGTYNAAAKELTWTFAGVGPGQSRIVNFYGRPNGGKKATKNTAYLSRSDTSKVESASDGGTAQRGFFWLADFDRGSNATPDFADWIVNGYPGQVGVGAVANGTGVRSSLKSALAGRMAKDPSVVLPLYNYTVGGGSKGTYSVAGFAEFVITGFKLTGNPKTVTGYFTTGTVTAGAGGTGSLPDFGVRVIWLDS